MAAIGIHRRSRPFASSGIFFNCQRGVSTAKKGFQPETLTQPYVKNRRERDLVSSPELVLPHISRNPGNHLIPTPTCSIVPSSSPKSLEPLLILIRVFSRTRSSEAGFTPTAVITAVRDIVVAMSILPLSPTLCN